MDTREPVPADMTTTTPLSVDELPPCIRCGQPPIRELVSVVSPRSERWFECSYCHRIFSVHVVSRPAVESVDIRD
jgi:hypothetical protein